MPSNKTNPGEGENITDLYKKYYPLWKKIAFSICQENDLADDIVLESFTKLISKKELLELLDPSARMVYLKTTVRNTALKLMSKRAPAWKRQTILEELYETADGPMEDQIDYRIFLGDMLSKLSERDRELIFLRYFMDFSLREIAEEIGLKENSVAVYLQRAKNKLRKLLEEGALHE